MAASEAPSRSSADKAGRAIRKALQAGESPPPQALTQVDAWREAFAEPLVEITQSLRMRIESAKLKAPSAQRLKRKPQIVRKLHRSVSMRLSQMQDIGGCRAVLLNIPELRELRNRFHRYPGALSILSEDDYCSDGRPETGYRALHLVVAKDDRPVEVQLRTLRQHAWAEGVERAATLTGFSLKDGEGPEPVLAFFRLASDAFSQLDRGRVVSEQMRQRLRRLRGDLEKRLPHGVRRPSRVRLAKRRAYAEATNQWLIIYNWREARFEQWSDLGTDVHRAAGIYADYERRYSDEDGFEVVLIGADSERTIESTHAHYFGKRPQDIDPHGHFKEIL